jgi:hypothetical protein
MNSESRRFLSDEESWSVLYSDVLVRCAISFAPLGCANLWPFRKGQDGGVLDSPPVSIERSVAAPPANPLTVFGAVIYFPSRRGP